MAFINDLINRPKYSEAKKILKIAGKVGKQLNQDVYAVGGLIRDIITVSYTHLTLPTNREV